MNLFLRQIVATIAVFLLSHLSAMAVPTNDNFAYAQVISGFSGSIEGYNASATTQSSEPSNNNSLATVWYKWTAPTDGTVTFHTVGSNFDTVLSAFTGTVVSSLNLRASDNDSGGSRTSVISFAVTFGDVYWIQVGGNNGAVGLVALNWTHTLPAGDFAFSGSPTFLENAGTATITVQRTGSTAGAVSVNYTTFDDTAANGTDFIQQIGTLSFASGVSAQNITVTLMDNPTLGPPKRFGIELSAPVGATIATTKAFINILDDERPANDNFTAGQTIAGASGTTSMPAFSRTVENNEVNGFFGTVWFNWTAPSTGNVIFDTVGTGFDSAIAVYTGTELAKLTLVGQMTNHPSTSDPEGRVLIAATAGTTYRIQVADEENDGGEQVVLTWSLTAFGGMELGKKDVIVFENSDTVINFDIRRIGGNTGAVTVNYVINDGTAFRTLDFSGSAVGTINFLAGETSKTLSIPLLADTLIEGDENAFVTLTGVTGGAVLGNTLAGSFTIIDDDDDPSNDVFTNARVLAGPVDSASVSNSGADVEPGEPDLGNAGSGIVWFKWTAPSVGTVRFQLSGANTVFGVYTGTTLGDLSLFGYSNSDQGGGVDLPTNPGSIYYLAAAGQNGFEGNFTVSWTFVEGGTFTLSGSNISEAGGDAIVTVRRTVSTTGTASVRVRTTSGSALSGTDFAAANTVLTFAPGETSKTVAVPIVNDSLKEGDESFNVLMELVSTDVLLGPSPLALTILDDDEDPANDDFADASVITGATGNATGTTTGAGLETNEPAHGTKSVWFRWTAPASGLVTFTTQHPGISTGVYGYSGSTLAGLVSAARNLGLYTARMTMAVTANTVYRVAVVGTEGGAGDFTLSWALTTGSSLIGFRQTAVSVYEPAGIATLSVTRGGDLSTAASVQFATSDFTAVLTQDYTANSGTLNFAANEVEKTITIAIVNDSAIEGNESLKVTLSNEIGALIESSKALATLTIRDDDDDPSNNHFSAGTSISGSSGNVTSSNIGADSEAGEPTHGGSGGSSVWFKWTAPVSGIVKFSTSGSSFDTLLAGYSGSTINALTQLASNDNAIGLSSQISFLATAGNLYHIAVDGLVAESGVIALKWTTQIPGLLQLSSATYTRSESGLVATFTVNRSVGSNGHVSVQYATTDGTAASGFDYSATSGSLYFGDGETSKSFTVPIISDAFFEIDETVLITLTSPGGDATLGLAAATLTIIDDDVFIPIKGAYGGLITTSTFQNTGTGNFSILATATRSFTGKLVLAGKKFAFKGIFDADGYATVNIPRLGTTPLTIVLQITAGTDEIFGTVSDGVFTAQLDGDRTVFSPAVPTSQFAGKWTMILPGDETADATFPRGHGFALVTIGTNGLAKIIGQLSDGTPMSLGVQISKKGELPIYAALYKLAGSLSGKVTVRPVSGVSDADGTLRWFRPSAPLSKIYPAGFSFDLPALMSRYNFKAGERILLQLEQSNGFTDFDAGLGNLPPAGLFQRLFIDEGNVVTIPPNANNLKLKFLPATGFLSGTFKPVGATVVTSFKGVVFRTQGLGAGFFLGAKLSGLIESGFIEVSPAN